MRSRVAMVLAVMSLFGLAACGDNGTDTTATTGEAITTTVAKATEVLVTVDDSKVTLVPDKVEAGLVKFTVTNSQKTDVSTIVVKLDAGKTNADLAAELAKDGSDVPPWMQIAGGPLIEGAKTTTYETVVDVGQWAFAAAPDDDDATGKPISTIFAVTASMAGAAPALPATDAIVSGTEYSYDIKGLKAGKQRVTVKNTGGLPHIYVVFGLKPDGKLDDVLAHEGDGPPPGATDFDTNLGYLDAGKSGIIEMDLAAGKYGMACFLEAAPDGKTGKGHWELGMKQEFTVA